MRARIARSTAAPPTLQHQPHPSSSFCCDAADPLCCSSARERGPSSGRKPQQHKPLQQQLQKQLLLLLLLQLIGEAAAISVRHPSARSFGFVSGPLGGPLPWSARKGVFNGVRGASQLSGLGALWKGGDHRDTVTATGAPGGPSGTFLEGGQEAPELCLALETSCDDTAAAVVSSTGEVLSNCVWSQGRLNAAFGGVCPAAAAAAHRARVLSAMEKALFDAGVDSFSLKYVAFTEGPGLSLCLRVAAEAAAAFVASLATLIKLASHKETQQPPSTNSLNSLLSAAYETVIKEFTGAPNAKGPPGGPPEGLSNELVKDPVNPPISIEPFWHLCCSFRALLSDSTKPFYVKPLQHQQQGQYQVQQLLQQKAAAVEAVRQRISAAASVLPAVVGVHHLQGHAFSTALPGAAVHSLSSSRKAPHSSGDPYAQTESTTAAAGAGRGGATASHAAAAAATTAGAAATGSAAAVVTAARDPVAPMEPLLCALLTGANSQFSILQRGFVADDGRQREQQHILRSPMVPQREAHLLLEVQQQQQQQQQQQPVQQHFFFQPRLDLKHWGAEGVDDASRASVDKKQLSSQQTAADAAADAVDAAAAARGFLGGDPSNTLPLPYSFLTLGRTLDDALGEALDKAARQLRTLAAPTQQQQQQQQAGGAYLESMAAGADSTDLQLPAAPLSHMHSTLNMSFSGIKAHLMRQMDSLKAEKGYLSLQQQQCVAKYIQDCLFSYVCRRLSRVLWLTEFIPELKTFALVGGVCRNRQLQQQVLQLLEQRRDPRVQQREFAALKKRLLKLVQRLPLLMVTNPSELQQQQQQQEEEEASVREALRVLVGGFSFADYTALRFPLSSFTSFCSSLSPAADSGVPGPLCVSPQLLAAAAAAQAARRDAEAEAEAATGAAAEAESTDTHSKCSRFNILLPGRQLLLQHCSRSMRAVPSNLPGVPPSFELFPASLCYCNSCKIISNNSNSSSGSNSSTSGTSNLRGMQHMVVPAAALCNDNAAMIGWAAFKYIQAHRLTSSKKFVTGAGTKVEEQQQQLLLQTQQLKQQQSNNGVPVPFISPKWSGGVSLVQPLGAMELLLLHALLQKTLPFPRSLLLSAAPER